jgi:hypothetical protein
VDVDDRRPGLAGSGRRLSTSSAVSGIAACASLPCTPPFTAQETMSGANFPQRFIHS